MKTLLLTLIAVFIIPNLTFAAKTGALPEVMKPEMMRVSGNELFIVQGAEIYNYSLPDLKLIRSFGKKGEGPGELTVSPTWFNTVTVTPDHLFVDGLNKVIYFSREGKLIKEIKKKGTIEQTFPVGKNFLVLDQIHIQEKIQYQVLNLCDASFQKIKELCRQISPFQSVERTTVLVSDSLDFQVWEDKIYMERSPRGFVIEVYDSSGKLVNTIKKEMEKIPVTGKHKEEGLNIFKADPFVKEIGYENFKRNMSEIRFPDFFPVIQSIDVSNGFIYVRTFKRKGNKEECIVMDLKGKVLRKKYLPRVENAPFLAHALGIRYYTIHNNTFYYLAENEDDETWELYTEEI